MATHVYMAQFYTIGRHPWAIMQGSQLLELTPVDTTLKPINSPEKIPCASQDRENLFGDVDPESEAKFPRKTMGLRRNIDFNTRKTFELTACYVHKRAIHERLQKREIMVYSGALTPGHTDLQWKAR